MSAIREIVAGIHRLELGEPPDAEEIAYCAEHNVTPSDGQLPPLQPPGTVKESYVNVSSNVFPMRLNASKLAHVYAVKVFAVSYTDGQPTYRELTAISNVDYWLAESRRVIALAFKYAVKRNNSTLPPLYAFAYDGSARFYCTEKLSVGANGRLTVTAKRNGDSKFPLSQPFSEVLLEITDKDDTVELTPSVVEAGIGSVRKFERCLDVVTNQGIQYDADGHVCFGANCSYLLKPEEFGFDGRDAPELPGGAYVALGAQKTVRLFRSEQGNSPAMVIAAKKTPFFACISVARSVFERFPKIHEKVNGYLSDLQAYYKHLVVNPTHLANNDRPIQIHDIIAGNAINTTFEYNGEQISVQDYYKRRYNIDLRYPRLPLMVCQRYKNQPESRTYHPMELYTFADNQRLKQRHNSADVVAALIKVAAVEPLNLIKKIFNTGKALHLLENKFLKTYAVEVGTMPIQARGRIVPLPAMIYANTQVSLYDRDRNTWRSHQFFKPAKIGAWGFYVREDNRAHVDAVLERFINAFVGECLVKGMEIGRPTVIRVLDTMDDLAEIFTKATDAKFEFLMFISNKEDKKIHPRIKKFERAYNIITQNVTVQVAMDACGAMAPPKRLTMENIVAKTNIKMGGLNYKVGDMATKKFHGDEELYIGINADTSAVRLQNDAKVPESHAGTAEVTRNPLVVGFTGNDTADHTNFTGDYIFQEPRRLIKISVVMRIVTETLDRFIKNRKAVPKRVFVYRNGLPESVFTLIAKYEIPAIKALLKQKGVPHLIYIVPNKFHNIRLYPTEIRGTKAWEQNLPIGTVVDTRMVSPLYPEFYILGHVARLGTAKIPRYSVLCNDPKLTMDQLQTTTLHLCFGHQIITGATSLPSPVFIANRYAERGKMNWMSFHSDSSITVRDDASQVSEPPEDEFTYEFFTHNYSYSGSHLRNVRFNA
ncbi:unnamed protein product [Bursaphelenchus xylophilus]|uniref:(pine wood nematode) hypothetical protein n=1 Tax=Bursaphelenchus xylophilus TaxID=6326 RepID=A0A1I7RXN5_BURXY|nr:unnamed protein product [Bursaphelenchus xylophilus]CAG9126614.1 unnamed protein product [Bursaphelenchus xylophilus]